MSPGRDGCPPRDRERRQREQRVQDPGDDDRTFAAGVRYFTVANYSVALRRYRRVVTNGLYSCVTGVSAN